MIAAYLHGVYPRSESLVAATRGLDRARIPREAVDAQFAKDLRNLVDLQVEAGLDLFSDGLLRWPDLFRPFIQASSAIREGALVRWFDTNTFFRAPEVGRNVEVDATLPEIAETIESVPRPRVATLPSPLVFSRVSSGWSDPDDLMADLAQGVLRPIAAQLVRSGCSLIHYQEPWIAFHGARRSAWRRLEDSLRLVTEGLPVTTVLHTYFGDASRYVDELRRLPVDVVGFDFAETNLERLGTDWDKGLLVGCIDGRRSLVESVDDVVAFVQRVSDQLRPPRIYLSSTSDLERLPHELARQKVAVLGEAAQRLKELL